MKNLSFLVCLIKLLACSSSFKVWNCTHIFIKTYSSVSAAKKTKKHVWHTSVLFTATIKLLSRRHTVVCQRPRKQKQHVRHASVLFTGTVKLLNSAFCISKTTKLITTKFIYFLPYIYTTSHIKIEGNHFSSS